MKKFHFTYASLILINTFLILCYSTKSYSQTLQTYFPETDDQVTLLKRYGDTLFVGGFFKNVDSIPRSYLCAIEISTGNVLAWAPNPNKRPTYMEVYNDQLIVAGFFDSINGTSIKNIAIYSLPNLQLLSLTTVPDENIYSYGFSIFSNYLYYIGDKLPFTGRYVSRFDLSSLQPDTLLRINIDGGGSSFSSILVDSTHVYVAGDLSIPSGPNNLQAICRFNLSNQQFDNSWLPDTVSNLSPWNFQIGKYNNHIYLGGNFTSFSGVSRKGIVEIDLNGNVTNKSFYLSNNQVHTMEFQGNTIWIGSNSSSIGGASHSRVSQVNINSGYSTCWYPTSPPNVISAQPFISAIEVNQDTVFLGGPSLTVSARFLSMFTGNPSHINLGPDLQLCPPVPFTLNAAQGNFTSFIWSNGATTSTITSQQPGLYWVTASDANGCSATDSVMVDFCAAIPGISHQDFVKFIYANNRELSLDISSTANPGETKFEIYTIEGRLLKVGNLSDGRNIISLPDQVSGLLICKVIQAEKAAVFRFFAGQ
jgi:hypothetical protein